MEDPPKRPSDGELRESYEQAILKGKQLFGELGSWTVGPSSTQLLEDLYCVESAYIDAPEGIKPDLANWNVNVDCPKIVDVASPRKLREVGRHNSLEASHESLDPSC